MARFEQSGANAAVHQMNLRPQPFAKIADGSKTIELRLNDERRQGLQVGDIIAFTNEQDGQALTVRILALHRFENFAQLYQTLDLVKCGYSAEEVATARAEDMLQYYSAERQSKYGVLGIEIEPVR